MQACAGLRPRPPLPLAPHILTLHESPPASHPRITSTLPLPCSAQSHIQHPHLPSTPPPLKTAGVHAAGGAPPQRFTDGGAVGGRAAGAARGRVGAGGGKGGVRAGAGAAGPGAGGGAQRPQPPRQPRRGRAAGRLMFLMVLATRTPLERHASIVLISPPTSESLQDDAPMCHIFVFLSNQGVCRGSPCGDEEAGALLSAAPAGAPAAGALAPGWSSARRTWPPARSSPSPWPPATPPARR